ncbi:MAG: hypothetical protein AB7C95_00725 [Synergistaceae bacterium]
MKKTVAEAEAQAREAKLDHLALQIGCTVIDSDFWPVSERRAPRTEENLRKLFGNAFNEITERIIRCSR